MFPETFLFILGFLLLYTVLVVYAERKVSAFMQDRLGPMEVGYYGLLQTVADLLKLLQKEDIVNRQADRLLFRAAPVFIFVAVFTGFSVLPLSMTLAGSGISSGVFFLVSFVALDAVGILMAGWSSHNKYAALGTLRGAAQFVSYEVPLGLTLLCVVVEAGTLDLQSISIQQGIHHDGPTFLWGIRAIDTTPVGGFLSWNIFHHPFMAPAALIFFVAGLAECNRAPFDLPEAESELVAGFQTEYSGFRWAIIMLSEYAMMLLISILTVVLFLGSWNTPLPNIGSARFAEWTDGKIWGIFWLCFKSLALVFVQIWIRWTYPRVRVDQLTAFSWKWLTPSSLVLLLFTAVWKLTIG